MRNDSSGTLNAPRAETLSRLSEREITGSCKRSSLMNSGHKEETSGSTDVNVFRSTSKELNFNLGESTFPDLALWQQCFSFSHMWLFNVEVGAKDKCMVFDRMTICGVLPVGWPCSARVRGGWGCGRWPRLPARLPGAAESILCCLTHL